VIGCQKESPKQSFSSSLFGGKDGETIPANAQGCSSTRSPMEASTSAANPEVRAQTISSNDLATRSLSCAKSLGPISPESKADNGESDGIDRRPWIGSPGKALGSIRDSQTPASGPICIGFHILAAVNIESSEDDPKSQSLCGTSDEVIQPSNDRQSAEYHGCERFLPAPKSSSPSPCRSFTSRGLSTKEGSRGSSRGSRSPTTGINQSPSDVFSVYKRSSRGMARRESSRSPIREIDKWQSADAHRQHDAQRQIIEKRLRDFTWTVDMSAQKKADEQSAMKNKCEADLELAESRRKVEMCAQKLKAEEEEITKRKETENESSLRQLEQQKEAILILLSQKSGEQMATHPVAAQPKKNSQTRGSDGMWRDDERQDEDSKNNRVQGREFADITTLQSAPKGPEHEISTSMLDNIENDSKTQLPDHAFEDSFKFLASHLTAHPMISRCDDVETGAKTQIWKKKPQDSFKLAYRRRNEMSDMKTCLAKTQILKKWPPDWTEMPQDSFRLASARLFRDDSRGEIPPPQLLRQEDVFDKFKGKLQVDVRENSVEASFKNVQSKNPSVREVLEEQERLKEQIKILEVKVELESERIKLEANLREKQKLVYEREVQNDHAAKSPRSSGGVLPPSRTPSSASNGVLSPRSAYSSQSSATRPGGVLPPSRTPSSASNGVLSPRSAYSSKSSATRPGGVLPPSSASSGVLSPRSAYSSQSETREAEERSRELKAQLESERIKLEAKLREQQKMLYEREVQNVQAAKSPLSSETRPGGVLLPSRTPSSASNGVLSPLSDCDSGATSERPLVNMTKKTPLGANLDPSLGPAMFEAQKSEKGIKTPWQSSTIKQSNKILVTAGPARTELPRRNAPTTSTKRISQERVPDSPVVEWTEPIKAAPPVTRPLASKAKFTGIEEVAYGAPVPGRVDLVAINPELFVMPRRNPQRIRKELPSENSPLSSPTDTEQRNAKLSSESLDIFGSSQDEDTDGSKTYNNGINTQDVNERKGPLLSSTSPVRIDK
jgi:hypothetical protein